MHRVPLLILACILTFAAIGCEKSQTMKDSWKFTTRQYRNYLNTPASVDLSDKGSCEVYELALGEAVLSMDLELQKLIRAMENSDHNPDQNWVMSMMGRFPWLSGVALADGAGAVVAQYPELFAKGFDISPLLEADPKQRPGALRAYAKPDDGGAEIYLANPVFGGEEMRGLIVAHFDARTLATLSGDPGSFVIASPVGVIWPGNYGNGGPAAGVDWPQLLTQKSCGLIGNEGSQFFWTTRYLGNLALVYAMPTSAKPSSAASSPEAEQNQGMSEPDGQPGASSGMEGGQAGAPSSATGASSSGAGAMQEPMEPPVEDGPPNAGNIL